MARPTKYCRERTDLILAAIRDGLPHRWAAAVAGISVPTLMRWRARYDNFVVEIERAEADFVATNVAIVLASARGGKSEDARWLLERRAHEDFGRREVAEVRQQHTGEVVVRVVYDTDGPGPD